MRVTSVRGQLPVAHPGAAGAVAWLFLMTGAAVLIVGCREVSAPPAPQPPGSAVSVSVSPGGPIIVKTSAAEFDLLRSGYFQAYLLKGGERLTLEEPESVSQAPSDYPSIAGKEVRDLALDFDHVRIMEAEGKIGSRGKRIEITGRSSVIEETLAIEVCDDFPNLAVTTVAYKNVGTTNLELGRVVADRHRLSASRADPTVRPFDLWSFQGSSYAWGKDDVLRISKNFSQPNLMGAPVSRGEGGGIPVVAFWTGRAGEAIGHLETLPLVLSLPVKVEADGRISASVGLDSAGPLKPGEVYSTPRTFVAVYAGDYYEPLRLWSSVLEREGWRLPKPNREDYQISWCGWGYESEVTPSQMLGTIPKLKKFNIHWATLDDRWFNNYGDWEPRADTFPSDSIQNMVKEFHRQDIKMQIWWLPIAVEDGLGRYESHRYGLAAVAKQHSDWLILDKSGKHAHTIRNLAALCPAVPEVQEYYKKLTEKFIRDWDFDGHKLDNVYTVPACYNPRHHHASPEDSINAVGEVYKVIFETTRALKPESVTQSCPCGTPPNLAWLPYLDQAVTADPVGSVQVRRRIKMYKALLGPQAAVYGDHVELTRIVNANGNREIDLGRDFASTVGTGGVVGTKFVWPDPGPRFKTVLLTPEKEAHWKKWIDLYNSKMLSQGTFLDLYVTGYDVPEGYAIEKDGKMYYAFFAPDASAPWKGEIELRGLGRGKYQVVDYENGQKLGTIDGENAKLAAAFTHHLLLAASRL